MRAKALLARCDMSKSADYHEAIKNVAFDVIDGILCFMFELIIYDRIKSSLPPYLANHKRSLIRRKAMRVGLR